MNKVWIHQRHFTIHVRVYAPCSIIQMLQLNFGLGNICIQSEPKHVLFKE